MRWIETMAEPVAVPWFVRWIAAVLRALPGPTEAWADIVGHLAWPLVLVFLVLRFRRFLKLVLTTVADRVQTDHLKLGWFEIRHDDQIIVLDPQSVRESTLSIDEKDVGRIERLFEFIDDARNFDTLALWVARNVEEAADIEDFLTQPIHANSRERAFSEVEGLAE
jgi:hypothetical protein